MKKTVLISGASSGIGLACVKLFARNGYRVLCAGRDPQALELAVDQAKKLGASDSRGFTVDFGEADAVSALFENNRNAIGSIDCLVNSAGMAETGALREVSDADWERTFRVNVTASFAMIREAVPLLEKSDNGAVVNVSSIAGRWRSRGLSAAYSTSKAAIIGMTRHLAGELGPRGVRVNAVCPSQTQTPMLDKALSREQQDELAKSVPLGRLATPEEQAEVIYFLCSSASSYMNGAIVDVNGGLL